MFHTTSKHLRGFKCQGVVLPIYVRILPQKNIEGGAGNSNYEMGKVNDVEFDKTIT